MTSRNSQDPANPQGATPPGSGERFVERMLSGLAHPNEPHHAHRLAPSTPFQALRQSTAERGAVFRLQGHSPAVRVHADSPAIDVMTDFARVAAVSTRPSATVDEALRAMHSHRVRALFVVDDQGVVLGLITSTDVLGERPVQIAQQRGVRHDEVQVYEVMTPADRLETMEFQDVLRARVGDVVSSLRHAGRRHALVVESAGEPGTNSFVVRGMFSVTQIARLMGLPPEPHHDVAKTFAEIEAAIGGA